MKFLFLITILLIVIWPVIGPTKQGRQGSWYCKKGHEHSCWLNAVICDLFFRKRD